MSRSISRQDATTRTRLAQGATLIAVAGVVAVAAFGRGFGDAEPMQTQSIDTITTLAKQRAGEIVTNQSGEQQTVSLDAEGTSDRLLAMGGAPKPKPEAAAAAETPTPAAPATRPSADIRFLGVVGQRTLAAGSEGSEPQTVPFVALLEVNGRQRFVTVGRTYTWPAVPAGEDGTPGRPAVTLTVTNITEDGEIELDGERVPETVALAPRTGSVLTAAAEAPGKRQATEGDGGQSPGDAPRVGRRGRPTPEQIEQWRQMRSRRGG